MSSLTARERQDMLLVGRLVRTARKQMAWSQIELAKKLRLEQSALSRVESGLQNLTAIQWVELCRLTNIPMEAMQLGYIEFPTSLTLESGSRAGSFRIPPKYSKDRGSKVRSIIPFLKYFGSTCGKDKLEKYIRTQKIDPDFFLNLTNQLNLGFTVDMVRSLMQAGKLQPKDVPVITKVASQPQMHGTLHYVYAAQPTTSDLLVSYIHNIQHYDCNFQYRIETQSKKQLEFSLAPHEHVEQVISPQDTEMGHFLCSYEKNLLSDFSTYGNRPRRTVKELECYYKGHSRCVYQIDIK